MGRPPNLTSAAFACPIGAERVSRVTRSSCPINPGAVMTWCSAADFWPWVRRILTTHQVRLEAEARNEPRLYGVTCMRLILIEAPSSAYHGGMLIVGN